MRIKLTRKLALCIDGVDLSGHEVGDVFDLPAAEARLVIAEGWAEVATAATGGRRPDRLAAPRPVRAEAADESSRALRTLDRIRQVRRQLEQRRLAHREQRRLAHPDRSGKADPNEEDPHEAVSRTT